MANAAKVPTNETIETYNSAGGATYTSAGTWENLRDVDLPAISTSYGLEVTGAGPHADSIFMSGETSNSLYFRRVFATSSLRHGGIPGAGVVFRLDGPTRILHASSAYAQFQFLEAIQLKSGDDNVRVQGDQSAAIACISSGESSGGVGFIVQPSSGTSFAINCLAFNCVGDGFRGLSAAVSSCVAYNCLATDCGDDGFDDLTGKNCTSQNAPLDYENCTTTTCIDEDGSGDITATLDYVDEENLDFHLAATDTEAIGQGTDLSADATYPFDDDITGTTRSSWDIGPFAYVAAGPIEDGFSDSADAFDSLSVVKRMAGVILEASEAGESWATSLTARAQVAEPSLSSDLFSSMVAYIGGLAESAEGEDSFEAIQHIAAALNHPAAATDLFNAIFKVMASVAEISISSEVFASIITAQCALSEQAKAGSLFVSDVIKDLERSISEEALTSDAYSVILEAAELIVFGASASDTLLGVLRLPGIASEDAAGSDTFASMLRGLSSIHEGALPADAFASALRTLSALSDGIGAGDSFAAEIASGLSGSILGEVDVSSAFSSYASLVGLLSDNAESSAAFSSLLSMSNMLEDSAVSNAAFVSSVIADLSRSISDGSALADSFLSLLRAASALGDGAITQDVMASSAILLSQVGAAVLSGELFDARTIFPESFDDEATLLDGFSNRVIFRPSVLDTSLASDAWQTRLSMGALWDEIANASSVMYVPLPFNVGFLSATIHISLAVAGVSRVLSAIDAVNKLESAIDGSASLAGSVDGVTSIESAIEASLDINREYNEGNNT